MKVLTLGTFDLLHPGHVYLLQQCKAIAGKRGTVVVGLNPDEFVEQFKGHRPVQTYVERFTMIASQRSVDEIYPTPGQDAKPLIEEVYPDAIVIGSDWATPRPNGVTYFDQLQVTPEWLAFRNIALLYLDRSSIHSSTELKGRIRGS